MEEVKVEMEPEGMYQAHDLDTNEQIMKQKEPRTSELAQQLEIQQKQARKKVADAIEIMTQTSELTDEPKIKYDIVGEKTTLSKEEEESTNIQLLDDAQITGKNLEEIEESDKENQVTSTLDTKAHYQDRGQKVHDNTTLFMKKKSELKEVEEDSNNKGGENLLAGVEKLLQGIEKQLETKITKVGKMLETKISNVETKMSNMETKMSNMETKMSNMERKFEVNAKRVSMDIQRLEAKIETIETNLEETNASMLMHWEQTETTQQILGKQIEEVGKKIEKVEKRLEQRLDGLRRQAGSQFEMLVQSRLGEILLQKGLENVPQNFSSVKFHFPDDNRDCFEEVKKRLTNNSPFGNLRQKLGIEENKQLSNVPKSLEFNFLGK
eukprot:CAMPEP_0174276886 /NCGR_PEP_ID=MMETSP0439-20130205/60625_1 /TAXON_ID=0 /ORGANISM="Stereomyxa ramosa, Strain Chinc5" /LENGTH=380 /DNA_ID=CAMNT_0015369155 /DNA_START=98 /DNA_END=1241 /DNA_ORIENTATION=-